MALYILLIVSFLAGLISLGLKKNQKALEWMAIGVSVLKFLLAFKIVYSVVLNDVYALSSRWVIDSLSAWILLILVIVNLIVAFYSVGYFRAEVAKGVIDVSRVRLYYALQHFFMLAMFLAISTTSPLLMWIAIEATSLLTAYMISFYNLRQSTEAAWKYLIINSVGLLLAFLGTLIFLAVGSGENGLVTWQNLASGLSSVNPVVLKIAFVFILIGFGTKVGWVPMHTWRPDAYAKAPTPVAALLSGILLNVAFFAVLKFKMLVDLLLGAGFSQGLLIFFGIISIILSALIIFVQYNYKRLLAYSSIEHAGVMALGFGFGGIGIYGAMLHMLYHSLAKAMMFLAAGNILLKYSSTKIRKVGGALHTLP
ncbi:hydrogenase 4 subunit F, partial [Candidatus Uhrbacteria bacterium]|nr:hydrogenase 4 subunit F [Candidatus Uhrbacteria bacterium]